MNIRQSSVFLIVALTASVTAPQLHAQSDDDTQSIEQARTALEEAQTALETAQNTLTQAQEATRPKPAPKRQTAAKPKGDGKLYKWVDEKGKISYQDSPPPKNVKVLNSDVLKDSKTGIEPIKELHRASETKPILDGSVPVKVYTADNCKPCQSVVQFLTQRQVPFIELDIRSDRKARDRISKLSKQMTVPSLFIGERIIQGDSTAMITLALEEAGYLKANK